MKYVEPEMEILEMNGEVIVTVSVVDPESPPCVDWDQEGEAV